MKIKDLKKPDPGFLRVAFIGKEVIADDGFPYLIMALAEREDGDEVSSDFWILGESSTDSIDACITNRDFFRYEQFSDPQIVESVQVKAGNLDLPQTDCGWMDEALPQCRCQAMRLDECEDGLLILQYFLRNDCIPAVWAEKALDRVRLFLCNADPSDHHYTLCRQKDAVFSMGIHKLDHRQLAEHSLSCPYGTFDPPKKMELADHESIRVSIQINGLYRYDPWEQLDQFFAEQEERISDHFTEEEQDRHYREQIIDLIRVCPKGKQFLVLDWQSDSCVPRFFAKKHLDEVYCYEVQLLSDICIPRGDSHGLSVIDVVDSSFNSGLEIELFSYER